MTIQATAWAVLAAATLALLAGIFALYHNPLMQIYLSTWTIC